MKTFAFFLATAMSTAAVQAADYPVRPVRMLVPFSPGAASDFLARTIGQKLTEMHGQQWVPDNRPGAGGIIGSQLVSQAAPDGYTFAMIGQPHLVNALLQKDVGYRPLDVSCVAQAASLPNVITVSPAINVATLGDLVNMAKSRPGQLNFGSAGVGSSSHLAGELFKAAAGVQIEHVPFKIISDAFTEMFAGRVHMYVFPLPAAVSMVRDGKLKALAVGTQRRAQALPDVPTTAEAGLAAYRTESWFGIVAPPKLPAALAARVNRDITGILREADTKDRFQRQGADPTPGTPEDFCALLKSEMTRFESVVKTAGMQAR